MVSVDVCPPHCPPCILGMAAWLWGAGEEGSEGARAELGRCTGSPEVQEAVLGWLQWGDALRVPGGVPSRAGAPTRGQQMGLGALGCAWQPWQGIIPLCMHFPPPTPSLMSPTSSRKDFNPPTTPLCSPPSS